MRETVPRIYLRFHKEITDGLKSMPGIKAVVKVLSPKSIARSEGKAQGVLNKRELYETD